MFAAPQDIADALVEIGWDICTTASNHTMDQGWEGLVRTVDTHESVGIQTVGSYRTEAEAAAPVIVDSGGGVRVGFVSQTYGLNGIPKPEGRPWAVDLLDADAAIADAARAKAAGADIVAVHMHAGDEYVHAPSQQQRDFAEAVTSSEHVDFVFGQHAHVVQPIELVNGKWVVYGTGNLIAQSGPAKPHTYDGMLVQLNFTETEPGEFAADSVEWAPTMITRYTQSSPARVYFIPTEIHERPGLAHAMEESAARTRGIVGDVDGLTEVS
ncbi:MAG: CapA family protein [Propionibacterium sp.]|nr:CapA family protein [Propionibacterium sp.]